jgi:glucose-6-phosphate isomerase
MSLKDLSKISGLPLKLSAEGKLIFGPGLKKIEADIRTLAQMRDVLLDKSAAIQPPQLYYMYRGICLEVDEEKIKRENLRYDVTVIRAGSLGNEFVKTFGHYHPAGFPEIYEVLAGQAICLLQRPQADNPRRILECLALAAGPGSKILLPPGFGHLLINPSQSEFLVTANWISTRFSSQYSEYRNAGGGAYFFIKDDTKSEFIPNKYFESLPPLKKARAAWEIKEFNLNVGKPLYESINEPLNLDFLNHPDKYAFKDFYVEEDF